MIGFSIRFGRLFTASAPGQSSSAEMSQSPEYDEARDVPNVRDETSHRAVVIHDSSLTGLAWQEREFKKS